MTETTLADADIARILTTPRTIALVGASANPTRPSHGVGHWLAARGHRVIGINPGLAGQRLFGETVHATLAEVPDAVDMIDIFRRSEHVPDIVAQALARWPDLGVVWMQLGVTSADGAARARARGVAVIEDRCPKIEAARLGL